MAATFIAGPQAAAAARGPAPRAPGSCSAAARPMALARGPGHSRPAARPLRVVRRGAAASSQTAEGDKVLAGIMGLEAKEDQQVTMRDHLGYDGGPPRFFSPINGPRNEALLEELPLMLFLPGIDGTGMNVVNQFDLLKESYDIRCFKVPVADTSSFTELVDIVEAYLRVELKDVSPERPVYVMGESFGGLLALAVGERVPDLVNRLVLVNPATAFPKSVWPTLGPALLEIPTELYDNVLPFVIQPLITNPVLIAQAKVDPRAPPNVQVQQLLDTLNSMIPSIERLPDVLPKETLKARLRQLKEGNEYVSAAVIKNVQQRTLVVAGTGDWLIPSEEESKRLKRVLPRCSTTLLKDRSHAMLMEEDLDIGKVIRDAGFYAPKKVLTSKPRRKASRSSAVAGPVEVPTDGEVAKEYSEGNGAGTVKNNSPVFFSKLADGRVVRGLEGLPDERPLLLVGNHQTFAPDMPPLIRQFLLERGVLLRGLAHPIAFNLFSRDQEDEDREKAAEAEGRDPSTSGAGPTGAGGTFSSFGAVPVGARNLYRLLQSGEVALIYPGGVREAFKRRGEDYKLFWPTRPELIRMAAKHGATIVPLAAIGADDGFEFVADGEEVLGTPFLGDWVAENIAKIPKGRRGISGDRSAEDVDDRILPPIVAPKVPNRFYFRIGSPIETKFEDLEDPERVEELYAQVKGDLEEGIDYLLRKREDDPYGNFFMRRLYEETWNGKQAPTFRP